MDRNDPAYRGQADYNPAFLRVYDGLVLGIFARFVWRMSTSDLVRLYRGRDPAEPPRCRAWDGLLPRARGPA